MLRLVFLGLALLSLAACAGGRDLDAPPIPLGDFKLGHSVVVAPNLTKGPLSRDASQEEWIAAMDKALEDRFRRYEGSRLYHFGVSIEGYVLAQVGVPLVLQPKSVLIFRITLWDDALGRKLTSEPHEITVLEALSAETVVGSGLTQSREEQMENLTILAAKQVERWLVKQMRSEDWFRGHVPPAPEADAETFETPPGASADSLPEAVAPGEPPAEIPTEGITDPEVAPPTAAIMPPLRQDATEDA